MLEKTAKSRKLWPNSNRYRKRFFKMKKDMLTSGTFIWIHQELLFNSRSFVEALNLCPHLEKSPFYCFCLFMFLIKDLMCIFDKVNIARALRLFGPLYFLRLSFLYFCSTAVLANPCLLPSLVCTACPPRRQ